MSKYKPGYKTSEFWFTLVSFIFSGLYLMGVITDTGQKEELIGNVSHAVESCILIGGQLAILWKYINSRKEVKKSWWETQIPPSVEIDTVEVINNDQPVSKSDSAINKPRSNKSRSRKNNTTSKNKSKRSKKSSGN